MGKTSQALRIAAYWTPMPAVAAEMIASVFDDSAADKMIIYGGVLHVKHHLLVDYADPVYTAKVSERVATIKATLAAMGELSSFTVTAVAVPKGTAEDLHEPEPEVESTVVVTSPVTPEAPEDVNDAEQVATALLTGWLPDGWRVDPDVTGEERGIIIPDDAAPKGKARGVSTLFTHFHAIKTESGKVIKSLAPL